MTSQEEIFVQQEANAWFNRNSSSALKAVSAEHRVIEALSTLILPEQGVLLDIGGASGKVAEGFRLIHPGWTCRVVEPSVDAITAGQAAFPNLEFDKGSISQSQGLPWQDADIILVSGVFCLVDRQRLSRAICNVDLALKNGGLLVVSDFDAPFLRANPYKHFEGIYTYKQDYTDIFKSLGTDHLLVSKSENIKSLTSSDLADIYDTQWVTSVLKKDISGRYFKEKKP
jgi:SAM-dependent methyltransferase